MGVGQARQQVNSRIFHDKILIGLKQFKPQISSQGKELTWDESESVMTVAVRQETVWINADS